MSRVRNGFDEIAAAFRYFSTIPLAPQLRGNPPTTATLTALPLVGLVLGAIAGVCALGVARIDARFAPVTALALGVALTGALHLDGFLDSCDALFASVEPQRRLEIMKDPRHGSFALAGLLVLGVAWITGLAAVVPHMLPPVLAWSACVARAAAILNACRYAYAPGGDGDRANAARLSPTWPCIWLAAATLASLWYFPQHIELALWPLTAAIGALSIGHYVAGRLDGLVVGDSYGAVICIFEVLGIVVFSVRQ